MKYTIRKWTNTVIALFMVMISVLLLGIASIKKADAAETTTTRETKKIVSVMFDDSGSMTGDRFTYARYAFQILMSLLDSKDELYITLMNNYIDNNGNSKFDNGIDEYKEEIKVDLSSPDRNKVVNEVLEDYFEKPSTKKTPGGAVEAAVDVLEDKGLKTQEELLKEDPNNEYWLFILTDGEFDSKDTEGEIGKYIANFPSLHTIYLGFSIDAIDLSSSELIQKHKFTSYRVSDLNSAKPVSAIMQQIASQISGRYQIVAEDYTIKGTTLSIDLDKCGVPLSSISIVAQNCGAKLKSATYNGVAISATQECIIDPAKGGNTTISGMQLGYTGIIKGNPCFAGGVLELNFDKELSASANISILAEPATYIEPILEYDDGTGWKEVSTQYINENLTPKDKIRVQYKAFEYISNTEVDLETVFGGVQNKVTYAQKSFVCGEAFNLVQGINEIGLEVSVMNGAYTMYASRTCVVEANPSYYRVEADHGTIDLNSRERTTVYTVFVNDDLVGNVPEEVDWLRKEGDDLSKEPYYLVNVSVTNSKGEEIPTRLEIASDGNITVTYTLPDEAYGEYKEYFKVTSNKLMTRDHEYSQYYLPPEITVALTSDSILTYTNYQIEKNMGGLAFELTANGEPISFPAELFDYKVTLDGRDITSSTAVEGDRITYVPSQEDFGGSVSLGQKKIAITLTSKNNLTKPTSCEAMLTVTNAIVEIETLPKSIKKVDRFALEDTKAVMYFRIRIDGNTLTAEELQARFDSGALTVKDKGTFSGFAWLPCGKDVTIEQIDGESVVAVHVTKDWIAPFHSFAAMMILNGEKDIVITCHDVEHTDAFVFVKSPLWGYIWRILVILLVLHILLFIIGFFKSHNHMSGTFVTVVFGRSEEKKIRLSYKSINIKKTEQWLWHIKRFFFLKPYFACQDDANIGWCVLKLQKDGKTKKEYKKVIHEVTYSNAKGPGKIEFDEWIKGFEKSSYRGGEPPKKPRETLTGQLKPHFKLVNNGEKNIGHMDELKPRKFYAVLKRKTQEIQSVVVFLKRK